MSKRCSICEHPQADEITRALGRPGRLSTVADTFGVSRSALFYHRARCVAPIVQKALERQEALSGASILTEFADVNRQLKSIMDQCETISTARELAMLVREFRANYEVVARMMELAGYKQTSAPTVTIDAREGRFIVMPSVPDPPKLEPPPQNDIQNDVQSNDEDAPDLEAAVKKS